MPPRNVNTGKTKNPHVEKVDKSIVQNSRSSVANDAQTKGFVYVEKSITKNMGEYNSARVTIGMTVPIGATKQDIIDAEVTIDKVNSKIEKLIEEEVNILLGED